MKTAAADIPAFLMQIAADVQRRGGELYIVGGWVRDALLGSPSSDFDLEVYGITVEELLRILSEHGRPNQVGRSFGIITLLRNGEQYDFAFPRTENKIGQGHRGFMVTPDPTLTFDVASARRDFTINAMGMKLPGMELVDVHGGRVDIERGLLRHVSDAFAEDPLRALRAIQFAARFEMDVAPATQALIRTLPLEELSAERIFGEFKKLLLKSKKPSIGLAWMRTLKLLRYFPELEALIGVKQDPEWHPEGDVWTHTLIVADEAAQLRDELSTKKEQLAFMFGALCHDFGKPATTAFERGRWRSPGHEDAGVAPTRSFLERMTNESALIDEIVLYVRLHLRPMLLYNDRDRVTQGAVRRLAIEMEIPKIVRIAKADHFGRSTVDAIAREFNAGKWLLEKAEQLQVLRQQPAPFVRGRDLLTLGMKPGPQMGFMLDTCFEMQLDGTLVSRDDALRWLREHPAVTGTKT